MGSGNLKRRSWLQDISRKGSVFEDQKEEKSRSEFQKEGKQPDWHVARVRSWKSRVPDVNQGEMEGIGKRSQG